MRLRLYVDESGDHTYRNLEDVGRRYLGLIGVAIESDYYRNEFQPGLESLKQLHFPTALMNLSSSIGKISTIAVINLVY